MPFLWDDEGLLDKLECRLEPLGRPLVFVWRKLRCLARGHVPECRCRLGCRVICSTPVCVRCGATTTKLR